MVVGLAASLLATSFWGPNLPSTKLSMQPRLISSQQGLPPASVHEPLLRASHARTASRVAAEAAKRYAHFVNWDDNSFASLKRNARSLDVLIVEWLHLQGSDGSIKRDDPLKEALVRRWVDANAPNLQMLPLVNNTICRREAGTASGWQTCLPPSRREPPSSQTSTHTSRLTGIRA